MKLFPIALILCLLLPSVLFSQESLSSRQNVNIYLAPLSVFASTSRVRMGVEFDTGKKFGCSIDVGGGTSFMVSKSDTSSLKGANVVEIRPEFKLYFKRKNRTSFYFAVQPFFILKQKYYENDHYTPLDSFNDIYYQSATEYTQKMGGHFIYGLKTIIGEFITMDFYCGIGLVEKKRAYLDVVQDNSIVEYPEEYGFSFLPHKGEEVNTTMIHFTLGFKVGVAIPTKKK